MFCFVFFLFVFFQGVSYHLGSRRILRLLKRGTELFPNEVISGGEWISSIDMEMPGQLFLEMGVHMGMVWISMDICMNV